MHRVAVSTALSLLIAAALAMPAHAHPRSAQEPTVPIDATYEATDNIEYLGRFPEHSGNAGGRLVGDRFYLTDPRGVYVYDVSTPEQPTLLGSLPLPQGSLGAALAQEDPDTDGNILLVDGHDPTAPDPGAAVTTDNGQLHVVDVSDPANMEVLGTAPVADHTWTCVSAEESAGLPDHVADRRPERARERSRSGDRAQGRTEVNGCAYAYGRDGWIVDLTDPTNPTPLEQTWRAAVGYGDSGNSPYTHDLTEIAPGLVMSAGEENILMDTTDPANPVELTRVAFDPPRFSSLGYHQVEWPNGGDDPIAVFGTEIAPSGPTNLAGSDCEADQDGGGNSVIETWDASGVAAAVDAYRDGELTTEEFRAIEFTKLDEFDAGGRGIFLDGQAPGHLLYCAHWFELHPQFDGAGKMVVSYYDRGTRFVEVATDGTMTEIGWITPAEGYSGSAQWISDEVVYIMDYRRGMEVIKLTGDVATGTYTHRTDVIPASSTIEPAGLAAPAPGGLGGTTIAVGLGLLLLAVARRRRRDPRTT